MPSFESLLCLRLSGSQFIGGLRCAIGHPAIGQTPGTLLAKREKEQLTGGQLGFVTISRDPDGNGILRNVAPEGAMKFVPPAENRAPVRIRFALDDRVMNAVHAGRDQAVIEEALDSEG